MKILITPLAGNIQENEIYVLMKQGAYVYDATKHFNVLPADLKPCSGQELVAAQSVGLAKN